MPNVDEIIGAYIRLRDRRDSIKEKHKAELAPVYDDMLKLEGWLQRNLLKTGLQNFKGPHGVAYLAKDVSAYVRDRDAYMKFVDDRKAWDLLEARCNKSAAEAYADQGIEIPGVEIVREIKVVIRRS